MNLSLNTTPKLKLDQQDFVMTDSIRIIDFQVNTLRKKESLFAIKMISERNKWLPAEDRFTDQMHVAHTRVLTRILFEVSHYAVRSGLTYQLLKRMTDLDLMLEYMIEYVWSLDDIRELCLLDNNK